jgi:TonB family protein
VSKDIDMDEDPLTNAILPETRPPWKSLGASVLFQVGIVATILILSFLLTDKIEFQSRFFTVTYTKAPPSALRLKVPRSKLSKAPQSDGSEVEPVREEPQPIVQKPFESRMSGPVRKPSAVTAPRPPEIEKVENPPTTGLTPMEAGPAKPREDVKTGVLGDMASAGTGLSRTSSLRETGFGGLASGRREAAGHSGLVRAAGIQDASIVIQQPRSLRPKTEADVSSDALRIKSKPTPVYTEEARAKKIEGNVELAVVFKASGEVIVTRIIKGLGYGLDETAEAAARGIKFTPAKRNNESIDFEATVTVVFQLAS